MAYAVVRVLLRDANSSVLVALIGTDLINKKLLPLVNVFDTTTAGFPLPVLLTPVHGTRKVIPWSENVEESVVETG